MKEKPGGVNAQPRAMYDLQQARGAHFYSLPAVIGRNTASRVVRATSYHLDDKLTTRRRRPVNWRRHTVISRFSQTITART